LLADQIRARIASGELAEGERLPGVAEMMAQWNVGRPAVREALRILESESLVKVQRGNVGGAIVQLPSVSAAARSAALILHLENIPLRDIFETRLILETGAAYRAAEIADGQVVDMLQTALDDEAGLVDDARAWAAAAVRFHEAVVRASGVRTAMLFSDMTSEIIEHHQTGFAAIPTRDVAEERRLASRSHAKLLRHIKAGEGERARKHWHAHIHEINCQAFPADS